jgi:hypothetical protein
MASQWPFAIAVSASEPLVDSGQDVRGVCFAAGKHGRAPRLGGVLGCPVRVAGSDAAHADHEVAEVGWTSLLSRAQMRSSVRRGAPVAVAFVRG